MIANLANRINFLIATFIYSSLSYLNSCSGVSVVKLDQPIKHSYLFSDIGAKCVFKISAEGQIEWEYPVDQCTDAWLLENGNVLMSSSGKKKGGREVTKDKRVVWEYATDSEVWGCQRLENGNTIVNNWFMHKRHTDSTPFFEVTPAKKVVWKAAMHERMFDPIAIQIIKSISKTNGI